MHVPFNEAGAILPRILALMDMIGNLIDLSFNEAGAILPRIRWTSTTSRHCMDTFNEAGAILPRIPGGAQTHDDAQPSLQ